MAKARRARHGVESIEISGENLGEIRRDIQDLMARLGAAIGPIIAEYDDPPGLLIGLKLGAGEFLFMSNENLEEIGPAVAAALDRAAAAAKGQSAANN